MAEYLKLFENHTDYEEYMADNPTTPNVSYCVQQNEVHYNPNSEASNVIIAKFNITDTAHPTSLTWENGWANVGSVLVTAPDTTQFTLTYSDLVQYDSQSSESDPLYAYQFSSTGIYTFEFTMNTSNTELDSDMFCFVSALTEVVIPEFITHLPNSSFGENTNKVTILKSSVLNADYDAFIYTSSTVNIYVPVNLVDAYKVDSTYSQFGNRILPIPTVSSE